MSTHHARRPVESSRTTYIRSTRSGHIDDRSNANKHRLPPSGASCMLLWLPVVTILFVVANYTFKLFS